MLNIKLLLSFCVSGLLFYGCTSPDVESALENEQSSPSYIKSAESSKKYIVVLNEDVDPLSIDIEIRKEKVKTKAQGLLKKYEISGDLEETYQSALKGFTVKLTPGQARLLGSDNSVKIIEPDAVISLSPINAT
ncbi:MAG: protease inhibitor I9 family protein, partial [Paludibacter sp.]|nr:protease inhibitor I9 family protein [Paludibacter sp.]